jgi:hypothetical protein
MRYAIALTLLTSVGCAHMSDPCTDTLLNRVASPDGALFLSTYHRACRHAILTDARVEKPALRLGGSEEVVCYLLSWGDKYAIDAEWKSNDAISVSTTDRVEKVDVGDLKESCEGIKVSYIMRFRNDQQRTDDEAVLSRMRGVLSDLRPCIDAYYKSANSPDSPVSYMSALIDRGEHRSALQNVLAYTSSTACPLSAENYDALSAMSSTFDLKPAYLDSVASLVKR